MANQLWSIVKEACFSMEDSTMCTGTICTHRQRNSNYNTKNRTQVRCRRCGKFVRRKDRG